jgi:hypothetical protein
VRQLLIPSRVKEAFAGGHQTRQVVGVGLGIDPLQQGEAAVGGLGTDRHQPHPRQAIPPALPEVLDAVYARQRLLEGADEVLDALVADRASGLYGVFICAGTILAPVVGSWVFSALGGAWGQTCDVFSVVGGIWTLTYAVFNVLPDVHREAAQAAEMEKILSSDPVSITKLKSMYLKDDPTRN